MDKRGLSKTRVLLPAALIVLLLLVVTAFIRVPYSIKGPCRFLAQYEWSLINAAPEKLLSRLVVNNPHQIQDFDLLQFDRPDFVHFALTEALEPGKGVEKGDVIGSISSVDNRIRLDELRGALDQAKANLNLVTTGEKAAVQQQAEQELYYAKSAYESFKPQATRKQQLFEDGLISQEEWEQTETAFKLLELDVSIAQANLSAVQSGEKTEAVEVIRTEISALESQVKALETKLAAEVIRAPISGILVDSYEPDTICIVAKIDTMVVQIPVDERQRRYANTGMTFQVKVPAVSSQTFSGTITAVGQKAQLINNRMMFVLTGTILNPEGLLLPGLTGYVKMCAERAPVYTVIGRWWRSSRFLR